MECCESYKNKKAKSKWNLSKVRTINCQSLHGYVNCGKEWEVKLQYSFSAMKLSVGYFTELLADVRQVTEAAYTVIYVCVK